MHGRVSAQQASRGSKSLILTLHCHGGMNSDGTVSQLLHDREDREVYATVKSAMPRVLEHHTPSALEWSATQLRFPDCRLSSSAADTQRDTAAASLSRAAHARVMRRSQPSVLSINIHATNAEPESTAAELRDDHSIAVAGTESGSLSDPASELAKCRSALRLVLRRAVSRRTTDFAENVPPLLHA